MKNSFFTTCIKQSGFVALFAVLISSIVLTIAFGLVTIALKEILLSAAGRESQFGFYAADSGIECALYLDNMGKFSTSTEPTSVMRCNDQNIVAGDPFGDIDFPAIDFTSMNLPGTPTSTTLFWFGVGSSAEKKCAKVIVSKDNSFTKIESFGYNICPYPTASDPRIIERAIRVTY